MDIVHVVILIDLKQKQYMLKERHKARHLCRKRRFSTSHLKLSYTGKCSTKHTIRSTSQKYRVLLIYCTEKYVPQFDQSLWRWRLPVL